MDHYGNPSLEDLKDETIKCIRMDNGTAIQFETIDGKLFSFNAVGDCCSSSWIEHLTNVYAILGEKVIKAEGMQYTDDGDSEDDYTSIKIYSAQIHTAKGTFEIEMRNSSNGYYGGWLESTCSKTFAGGEVKGDI